jgi:hypothetical protein
MTQDAQPVSVAVLCPGPSLQRYKPGDHAVTIGVNRAPLCLDGHGVKVDWWAFIDDVCFPRWRPSYKPKLFTTRGSVRRIEKAGHNDDLRKHHLLLTEDVPAPDNTGAYVYTKTAAIRLAVHLGAQYIDVYGDDRTDEPDVDGWSESIRGRNDARWKTEGEITDRLAKWVCDRGVTYRRVVPVGVA